MYRSQTTAFSPEAIYFPGHPKDQHSFLLRRMQAAVDFLRPLSVTRDMERSAPSRSSNEPCCSPSALHPQRRAHRSHSPRTCSGPPTGAPVAPEREAY